MKFFEQLFPKQNFKVTNQKELKEKTRLSSREIKTFFKESEKSARMENLKKSEPLEEVFGKEIIPMISEVKKNVIEEIKERGVKNVNLDPVFLLPNPEEKNVYARHTLHTIEFYQNMNSLPLVLRRIQFLKILSHEWYHSSSVARYIGSYKPKNQNTWFGGGFDITHELQNSGASHLSPKITQKREEEGFGDRPAFEEGLAASFEEDFFNKHIKKMFPKKDIEWYESLIEAIAKTDVETSDLNEYILMSPSQELGSVMKSPYSSSKHLVRFLAQSIPDFYNLVEKGRIDSNPLPLARMIEEKFGEGMYRKITTITVGEAEELLKQLQHR